jgi:peptidyl-tRNA hydrolase, PTH1 family
MIRLLVGLGNPGPEYESTRHNVGFWWVDAAAQTLGARFSPDKSYQGLVARCNPAGESVWLLKPQTFMNLSGRSVGALARFYRIKPEEILVVHDELDLPAGEAKLKRGGSHAGHNGLRDIHAQLGTDDYWRLKIGIGHPGVRSEVVHWVLKKPSPDQAIAIDQTLTRTLKALPALLAADMEKAMQLIHTSKPPRPKPPRPATAQPTPQPAAAQAANADTTPLRPESP